MFRFLRVGVYSSALFSVLLGGCAGSAGGVLPPYDDSVSGGAPINCGEDRTTVDAALSDGSWPFVVGRIESVKPVLDLFIRSGEPGASSRVCDRLGDAEPALRITLRVEQASWDLRPEEHLVLAVSANAFYGYSVWPELTKGGALRWSDGGTYFPKGARIAAIGGLMENGELYTRALNIVEVLEDGIITGYQHAQCVGGTLNDRHVDDVIEQAKAGWDGEPPMMVGDLPPVSTRCN